MNRKLSWRERAEGLKKENEQLRQELQVATELADLRGWTIGDLVHQRNEREAELESWRKGVSSCSKQLGQ